MWSAHPPPQKETPLSAVREADRRSRLTERSNSRSSLRDRYRERRERDRAKGFPAKPSEADLPGKRTSSGTTELSERSDGSEWMWSL